MRYFPSLHPNLAALGLCILGIILANIYAPIGFRGYDDLHYLEAAQGWVANGATAPENHWAARLPYVLALAASIKLFGISALALMIPNAAMFLVILVCGFLVTRKAAGAAQANWTIVALATTPFFFRMPTSYYPESMEVALSACTILLALTALWSSARSANRALLLLIAGLVGGIAILVRETAIALPASFACLLLIRQRHNLRYALADILILGAGYAAALIVEAIFYYFVTGDVFYRFTVDSHHILIPSRDLVGHVFTGGSPFFNWHLAALWNTRHSFHVHWAINPLLNLFLSQELILLPWLALGAYAFFARFSDKTKDIAILTGIVLAIQYVLNNFVIVIAPNVRYFGETIFLLTLMAGSFLFFLNGSARICLVLISTLVAVFIVSGQPNPPYGYNAVRNFYFAHPGTIYVPPLAHDRLYLLSQQYPALGHDLQEGRVPVGGVEALMFEDFSFGNQMVNPEETVLKEECSAGTAKWSLLEDMRRPSLYWHLIEAFHLQPYIPQTIAIQLRRDYEHVIFVRRRC